MSKRLEVLEKKRAQIQAQIKDVQAREKKQQRKLDTRRKIIAGGILLKHMEENTHDEVSTKMHSLFQNYVKPKDRHLFDILENEEKKKPANAG